MKPAELVERLLTEDPVNWEGGKEPTTGVQIPGYSKYVYDVEQRGGRKLGLPSELPPDEFIKAEKKASRRPSLQPVRIWLRIGGDRKLIYGEPVEG